MPDRSWHYPVLVRFAFIPFFTVKVIGISMEPGLHNGEVWLAQSGAGKVSPGRIVVFEHPMRPDLLEVKRAVRATSHGWWVKETTHITALIHGSTARSPLQLFKEFSFAD